MYYSEIAKDKSNIKMKDTFSLINFALNDRYFYAINYTGNICCL